MVLDQKLHDHVEAAVKRQEPSIQKLAKTYNKLCTELQKLIETGKAPHGAVAPRPIVMDHLFALDVDNEIWQDIGLDDQNDADLTVPPHWMSNDNVCVGIKALLEFDQCKEEEKHLIHEH